MVHHFTGLVSHSAAEMTTAHVSADKMAGAVFVAAEAAAAEQPELENSSAARYP